MNTAPAGEDDDYGWFDQTRAEIDARYRAAQRHSARVRMLKILLPTISVLAVVGFVGYFYVVPHLPANFGAATIDISNNAIVMQDPHVSGYLSGGRSYELKADRAEQSLANTKVVTLHNIGATIGMGKGETARIKPPPGPIIPTPSASCSTSRSPSTRRPASRARSRMPISTSNPAR